MNCFISVCIVLYSDDVALPIFTRVACPEENQLCTKTSTKRPPDLCVKVLYQDAEGSHDLLLMREKADAPTVLKGRLKSKPRAKAVIILADADNDADTVSNTLAKLKKLSL